MRSLVGVVAVAALSACSSDGSGEGDDVDPTPSTPSSSTADATETPSETTAPADESPAPSVGISGVRDKPTPEQVEIALQGIPGDLGPVEAAEYAGDILNIYNKSADGEIDPDAPFGFTQTAESAAEGEAILRVLYGDAVTSEEAQANLRARLLFSSQVQSSEVLGFEVDILLEYVADPSSVGEEPDRALVEYDAIYTDNLESPNLDYLEEDQLGVTMILVREGDRWTVQQQFVALS